MFELVKGLWEAFIQGWNQAWRTVWLALTLIWVSLAVGVLFIIPVLLGLIGTALTLRWSNNLVSYGIDLGHPRFLVVVAGVICLFGGWWITFRAVKFIWPLFWAVIQSLIRQLTDYLPVNLHR